MRIEFLNIKSFHVSNFILNKGATGDKGVLGDIGPTGDTGENFFSQNKIMKVI